MFECLLRARDIGDERFGVESQGESSPLSPLATTPVGRRVVCHPVPTDSTRGCDSAVLFLGLSHPTAAAATANLRDSGPAAADLAVFS